MTSSLIHVVSGLTATSFLLRGRGGQRCLGCLFCSSPLLAAVHGCCFCAVLLNTEIALNEFHDFCYTSVQVCE